MPERTAIPTQDMGRLGNVDRLVFHRFALTVVAGPDTGKQGTFGQETTQIGTARASDFVLTDRTVSRCHLKIETHGSTFKVADVGSTNGTFVGDLRIESAFLGSEARLRLGNTELAFKPLAAEETLDLPRQDRLGALVGRSQKMRQLYALLERVGRAELPVIIEGETGTGKELVARELHALSPRADAPFEVLDCSAIPDNLIESELFGHVRGAFTGAERDRAGVFERADHGTVFLDEIGELKLDLQPKLLRVLENKELRRLGDERTRQVDVRLVAATHRSVVTLVNQGAFREDLYYRLAGCKVDLPPLRERLDDIPLLVEHFAKRLGQAGHGKPAAFDAETLKAFATCAWPGNVRQLRNAVERYVALGVVDLGAGGPAIPATSDASLAALNQLPFKEANEAFERQYLETLVGRHPGNMRAAAETAEIHAKSLSRLLRRHAIGRE